MKKRKTKIWCEFSGRIDNIPTKRKIIYSKIKPDIILHEMIVPAVRFIRCPKCNKRCKLDHVVADGTLYLFSKVSRHKKTIKV